MNPVTRLLLLNRLRDISVKYDENTEAILGEDVIEYIMELTEWALEAEQSQFQDETEDAI